MDFRIKQPFLNSFHMIFIQFTDPSVHHKVWIFEGFSFAVDLFSLQQKPTHTFRAVPTLVLPEKEAFILPEIINALVMVSGPRPSNNNDLSVDTERLQIPASAAWIEYNTRTFWIKLLRFLHNNLLKTSVLHQQLPDDTFSFFFKVAQEPRSVQSRPNQVLIKSHSLS